MRKSDKLRNLAWPAGLLAGVVMAFAGAAPVRAAEPLKLHVPSPDWRDQVIYFVMTDRFADGDPANNDQGAGVYRPGVRGYFQGGDLKGLRDRVAYIQGLGATALWITPPVANQWMDPSGNYTGYHGYWARHFMQVDPHFGTLAEYRALSDALHRRGMYLVQDIVVNHTGNFFTYRDRWQAGDPAAGWEAHDLTRPVPRPTQPPFDRNDPRDPAQRAEAIYHWTPDVTDYNDRRQVLDFQMASLDDLNTENPVVRRALRASYGFWVREVGVDAFRVDTAFYVPPGYFADFLRATDPAAPGIERVARGTGRTSFFSFGEGFGIDPPGQEAQSRLIESYVRADGSEPGIAAGTPLMPGMLNFPLYGALGDVFARGRPAAELGDRIMRMQRVHADVHRMPSFIDNHDVDRFLAGGSVAGLEQALLALMTLPGIPVLYYGTEQGFTEQRAAMFAAGWGSGGRDRYDTGSALYRRIAGLTELRRTHRLFSRGLPTVLHGNAAGPGALVWRTDGPAAAPGSRRDAALVAFNTAEGEVLASRVATGLAPGSVLEGVYGLDGRPSRLVVAQDGSVSFTLPARGGRVWKLAGRVAAPGLAAAPRIDPLPAGARFGGDFEAGGSAAPNARVRLVLDGDVARASETVAGPDGRWKARVDTSRLIDPAVEHRLVAWAGGTSASLAQSFRIEREWTLLADVEEPAGNDRGPEGTAGRYTYPTDPGWGENRQGDIRRVRVFSAGGALRVDVTTNRITRGWNPANGFDRVLFTLFLELPGREGGSRVMPLQNAELPEGMRWHLRLRAGGWSNAMFAPDGASASAEGTPVTPAAKLAVDAAGHTVSFVIPAAALGPLPGTRGLRLVLNTWDYDGGYRALAPVAAPFVFGGGAPAGPKVMDQSRVITLP